MPPEPSSPTPARPRRRRSLAYGLIDSISERIRDGQLASGDKLPPEAAIMQEFDVSRTVVREAISKLQAAGMVQTRHGVGTFVIGLGDAAPFHIAHEQVATLRDVLAVLELRIGVETEAASLAAKRRKAHNLAAMRSALDAFDAAVDQGRDTVEPDVQFHLEIARATDNVHFANLISTFGTRIIPRARLELDAVQDEARRLYLRRVNGEHEAIYDAIVNQDADAARAAMRTHLANSRERRRRANLDAAAPPAEPSAR